MRFLFLAVLLIQQILGESTTGQSLDITATECDENKLYYAVGWEWTDQAEHKVVENRKWYTRLLSYLGKGTRHQQTFKPNIKEVSSDTQIELQKSGGLEKITFFRFRPMRSLLKLKRWGGLKVTGNDMNFAMRDYNAHSFNRLVHWDILNGIGSVTQKTAIPWKMDKQTAARAFKDLPKCSNYGLWHAYTVITPIQNDAVWTLSPMSWIGRFEFTERPKDITVNIKVSNGKNTAVENSVGYNGLFRMTSSGAFQPITFSTAQLYWGRTIIEFLESERLNKFLQGPVSDKYIRLAFNQFRPLASGVSSVDVELKCDCNHTQTITVENEKVQEFNDTTKGNLLNRGFNEAFNPVDSYLKPRPFRAFKHHPFALRDWLSDKHKLNNVLGRVYSYVLWFENPKKNQPIECHFKIASMRSKGKELHTVYTNSFTLVDSTDSNSSKNSKKNDGTGQLAKPTDAHADRSVGVPDILPQQPQPATQPKTQRQKPQREQRRREQREQRARQTETPSTAVCPRDQHPPNNNWVKNLVAVGAITGGLAAAIAFGSSSSSNTHHNHGHGK